YEALEVQHETVNNTIRSVSDISSATTPSFGFVRNDNDTGVNVAENLLDHLNSFTSIGRSSTSQIESLLQEIKTTLNHAGAVSGSTRFTDYKGNATAIALVNLKEYNQANQQIRQEQIEDLDEESRVIYEKAKEDYENGEIDKSVYDSIVSGVINTGAGFMRNAITEEVAKPIASAVNTWIKKNTTFFMNRALVAAPISGNVITMAEPPSITSQTVRTGARYGVPIVASAIDFSIMVYQGEEVMDATIKAGGHLAAGLAGAKVGAIIGSAVPIGGTAVGFIVGGVVGTVGAFAFDWVYDNKDDIVKSIQNIGGSVVHTLSETGKNIGEAVSGLFNGLGSVFE
ncbi:hypothetical protein, partial [Alkalihalobacterium chitinilyticum]